MTKPYKTPCGLQLAQLNKAETDFIYKEVFVDQVYLRHGITLNDGDCVFDIGANIGMFSVFLQERFRNIRVFAFEPSPEIFAVLRQNTSKYGSSVVAMPCGIAGATRQAAFTFYPAYSILSGFHSSDAVDVQTIREGVLSQWREKYLDQPAPDDRFLDALSAAALDGKREYTCQLRALSEVIRETQVERISLLKIDAEGSEWEILSGLEAKDWPKIEQIAMEIHGTNSADISNIKTILGTNGFTFVIEAEKHFETSGILNCYAKRV